jgi:ABC-2 type transport system ATP-binding protein
MEKLIQAKNLTKKFSGTKAVDNMSLQVRAGEIYGLVGPDGAGKTTMLRLLCGALNPDSGEVIVCGRIMAENPDAARENLGYLSQNFSLYEELTVIENIRFFAEVRGIPTKEWEARSMHILDFVGLSDFINRRAAFLSGGMKQKLGLASALVQYPRVLLLDEPTGGVDPVTRQDFWQLIIRLVTEESISVLVTTPYMDEATRCTYVGFMKDGRLILEEKPIALREQLDGRILELCGEPLMKLRRIAQEIRGVEAVQVFGDRLHIRTKPECSTEVIRNLTSTIQSAGITIHKINRIRPSLEDVFIELLER